MTTFVRAGGGQEGAAGKLSILDSTVPSKQGDRSRASHPARKPTEEALLGIRFFRRSFRLGLFVLGVS
jgi:hypothetical protein